MDSDAGPDMVSKSIGDGQMVAGRDRETDVKRVNNERDDEAIDRFIPRTPWSSDIEHR